MNDISVVNITCMVAFLGLAAVSAIFLKRLRFPLTIGLVIIGIVIGGLAGHFEFLAPMKLFRITPNLVLYVLLPALLFDAAVTIDIRLLIHNLTPTMILAMPGLLVATLVTGGLMAWLTPLPLGPAMVFGALISSTDPVAVIALFKELGAPRRLTMLVDGESLFNDATAMVAFQIICGLVAGGALSAGVIAKAGVSFVAVFLGGTLVGALIGWVIVRILKFLDNDPLLTIAFTMVAAYASFLIANYYLEVSGVMAVVGAGLVISWYSSTRFTPEVREYMHHFWSYAAFIANSLIFLLLGLTEFEMLEAVALQLDFIPFILAAVVVIIIARIIVVFGMTPLINRLPRVVPIDWRNQTAVFWGGLRGALPIGLAISLDQTFPNRPEIVGLTLGVVLFTLVVQGTTVGGLIRWLGLDRHTTFEKLARLNAKATAMRAALKQLAAGWPGAGLEARKSVEARYQADLDEIDAQIARMRQEHAIAPDTDKVRMMCLQLNNIELKEMRSLMEEGVICGNVLRRLDRESVRRNEDITLGLPIGVSVPDHPLEKRWSYRALMRLPESTLQHSGKNMLLRLLSEEYQYHCAKSAASARVLRRLSEIKELNALSDTAAEEARTFYETRRKHAERRLQTLAYRHPELVAVMQKNMLNGVARAGARHALDHVVQTGGLSESLAQDLLS